MMGCPSLEIVYAQKLLNRDLPRLSCDSFKEKNEKYFCCEDGWIFKEEKRDFKKDDDKHADPKIKFRQVWIQGYVVEYIEAKDWLLIDDGTGSPWTVVHAAKNPTSVKWLKEHLESDPTKKLYVQVLGEPVMSKASKDSGSKVIHIAAIKVQNLTSRLPSFTLADVDAATRKQIQLVCESLNYSVDSDAQKLQLYQWILEVDHMNLRYRKNDR